MLIGCVEEVEIFSNLNDFQQISTIFSQFEIEKQKQQQKSQRREKGKHEKYRLLSWKF